MVWLYEYFVDDSFDSRTIWRNIEKAVSRAMAEINKQVFNGGNDDGDDNTVDLGDWVFEGGGMLSLSFSELIV